MNIYCDGGASVKTRKGGFGVVVYDEEKNCVYSYCHEASKDTTNNREELKAILKGLEIAYNIFRSDLCILHSDSSYCINTCNKWIFNWASNDWKLTGKEQQIENKDLIEQIYNYLKKEFFFVAVEKIKGHAGHIGNELADALAHGEKEYRKALAKYDVIENLIFTPKELDDILTELDSNEN